MPNANLICETCGHTARRELINMPGSRGHHETLTEPATCPHGHGLMIRTDGFKMVDSSNPPPKDWKPEVEKPELKPWPKPIGKRSRKR